MENINTMANIIVTPNIFALALTISEILIVKIFDHQDVGQGHGVQFSQWQHSMANIKIYKCHCLHF